MTRASQSALNHRRLGTSHECCLGSDIDDIQRQVPVRPSKDGQPTGVGWSPDWCYGAVVTTIWFLPPSLALYKAVSMLRMNSSLVNWPSYWPTPTLIDAGRPWSRH